MLLMKIKWIQKYARSNPNPLVIPAASNMNSLHSLHGSEPLHMEFIVCTHSFTD